MGGKVAEYRSFDRDLEIAQSREAVKRAESSAHRYRIALLKCKIALEETGADGKKKDGSHPAYKIANDALRAEESNTVPHGDVPDDAENYFPGMDTP